jgi:tetratricopeptide (TPR) repeat protein
MITCARSRRALRTVALALALLGASRWVDPAPARGEDPWRTRDPVVAATNRGVAFMEQYKYADAVRAFEDALRFDPGSTETRVNLAIAIFNRAAKGDLERGNELLDAVLKDDPKNVRALYMRGVIYQYQGKDEQALPLFRRVLELVPNDACSWYLLARSKAHLDQPHVQELERAIEENPVLVSAYYDLMRAATRAGDQEKAEKYRDTFLRLQKSPLSDKLVMPNYNQMGPLARVTPFSGRPARGASSGAIRADKPKTAYRAKAARSLSSWVAKTPADRLRLLPFGPVAAMADVNGDGRLDLLIAGAWPMSHPALLLLLGRPGGRFTASSHPTGLESVREASSSAFGDYDNDNNLDIFVSCMETNYLFRGNGDGTFEDVTARAGVAGDDVPTYSAVFLDADHDADLDLHVSTGRMVIPQDIPPNAPMGAGHPAFHNQLLRNNGNGTFTEIATEPWGPTGDGGAFLVPGDLDGDRDTDLVLFNTYPGVYYNDRGGRFQAGEITDQPLPETRGGALQDLNGDGWLDLLTFPAHDTPYGLYLSDGTGNLKPSDQFDGVNETIATWGSSFDTRVTDVDLDGDLDIALFGQAGHVLLNDGWGRFVPRPNVWPAPSNGKAKLLALIDLTKDGLPDVLRIVSEGHGRIELVPTKMSPPANWMAITPTGSRGEDKRTRSPASGYGTVLDVRCGIHSQRLVYTGLDGGLCQSQVPLVIGLDGATKADYVAFLWPDGVTQFETELAAGRYHTVKESERKVSSCPVLFAWDGRHFQFITDFAGVGGLGYYIAPSQYSYPQALEHVKIEPDQLESKDGFYELRLTEPMEEVGYIDRVELLAVDHPRELSVYPDERLAVSGPPPTHRTLCIGDRIFPVNATAPNGTDCADNLTKSDRVYAYEPTIDRRYYGFCEYHTLQLDFGDRLSGFGAQDPVYLYLNGSIEYPYSQTTYAAAQSHVTWDPMKIERQAPDGTWQTIVPDAGAFGGMQRMITVDLTGKLPLDTRRLRISTNLEVYYDQIFVAVDRGTNELDIRSVPMADADLRRLGFPLEYTPDGRHPTIYSYDIIEPTSSFKMLKGNYTRYGTVETLLSEFDDQYVILGTGDEIAVRFDATSLPPLPPGMARSFILVSHAYCKDMDLYTATPDTVEPLPFKSMSEYPYPPAEHNPDTRVLQRYHQQFNVRTVP